MDRLDTEADGRSLDIVDDNLRGMRELFPEAFNEGGVDFEVLRDLLGDEVDDRAERYSLTWHGKSAARRFAQVPSTGTLRPCPEDSMNWATTPNLFIEGDNLEVLKLLQKSLHGRVKLVYIDPPYNTGKEFIYPDKYQDNLDTYLRYTGQVTDDGFKLSANTETSGRYHTNWLNMMYPRLKLARGLLREDGFIVVSIDDAEEGNLRSLLDEIYGEENRMAVLVWDRNRKNDARFFSVGHEYMLVYAKNKQALVDSGIRLREPKEGIDQARDLYASLSSKYGEDWDAIRREWSAYYRSIPDSSPEKKIGRFTKVGPRGPYRDDGDISWPGGGGPRFEVLHPTTGRPCKTPKGGWVYSTPEKFAEEVAKGRVVFGDDENTLPRQIRYLFESEGQVMPSVFYSYAQTATLDFVELMGARVFDNPKNWKDLRRMIRYLTEDGDIVLDFFAGSCSTAHGVLDLNAQTNGTRRFVMVQLPEPCDEGSVAYAEGYRTIADIGRERIRRALSTLGKGPDQQGFRCFRLDSTNLVGWDDRTGDLQASLLNSIASIKEDRSDEDVLYELLLKYGLDPAVSVRRHSAHECDIYVVADGALFVCLSEHIGEATAEEIVKIKAELNPDVVRVVFRDDGFENDVVKTNVVQILHQHGVTDVKSV